MENVKIIAAEEIIRDQRVMKEAKYIADLGYKVEILCWDREGEFKNREVDYIGDIKIKRFFPQAVYGSGYRQIGPFIRFIREVKTYLKKRDYKYLHCQNLDGFIVGFLAGRKKSLIFDMREFYEGREKNKVKKLIIRNLVTFAVRKSAYIIYVNDTQKDRVSNNHKAKLIYLPNYPQAELGCSIEKVASDYLTIAYIGGVRQYGVFVNLFEAVKDIQDLRVNIHGMGTAYKELKALEGKYSNIRITGSYNPSETGTLFSNSDLLYCVYSIDNENWRTAYPIKLFESIITLTPVIVSKGTVLENFANESGIGFVVDGGNIDEIRELIDHIKKNRYLLEDKQRNLRKIQYDYTWDEVVQNLNKAYY